MIKKIFLNIVGKRIKRKLDLKEDSEMTDKKKWWQSKSILTALVVTIVAVYNTVDASLAPALGFDLPAIPEWVFAILGAIGIWSRKVAKKEIG